MEALSPLLVRARVFTIGTCCYVQAQRDVVVQHINQPIVIHQAGQPAVHVSPFSIIGHSCHFLASPLHASLMLAAPLRLRQKSWLDTTFQIANTGGCGLLCAGAKHAGAGSGGAGGDAGRHENHLAGAATPAAAAAGFFRRQRNHAARGVNDLGSKGNDRRHVTAFSRALSGK